MEFKRGLDPRKALRIGPARTIEKHLRELRENYSIHKIEIFEELDIIVLSLPRANKPKTDGHYINKIIKKHPINEYIHKNYFTKDETSRNNFRNNYYFKIRKEYLGVFSTLEFKVI